MYYDISFLNYVQWYYIILYYIILYYIILYYIILYYVIFYRIIYCYIILYQSISYHIISYYRISYHVLIIQLNYSISYCITLYVILYLLHYIYIFWLFSKGPTQWGRGCWLWKSEAGKSTRLLPNGGFHGHGGTPSYHLFEWDFPF